MRERTPTMEMSAQIIHRLSVETTFPKKVVEGESFTVNYHITNIGQSPFPGGQLVVNVYWPTMSVFVNDKNSLTVGALQPKESLDIPYENTALASGTGLFTCSSTSHKANDGNPIEACSAKGRTLSSGESIGVARARGQEEISQSQSVQVAAVSLVILVIFQMVDWVIRYFYRF